MLVVGYGQFRGVRHLTSKKNGTPFNLAEFGSEDYRALSVFVSDDMVQELNKYHDGDLVQIGITAESIYGGGTRLTLNSIQMRK